VLRETIILVLFCSTNTGIRFPGYI